MSNHWIDKRNNEIDKNRQEFIRVLLDTDYSIDQRQGYLDKVTNDPDLPNWFGRRADDILDEARKIIEIERQLEREKQERAKRFADSFKAINKAINGRADA